MQTDLTAGALLHRIHNAGIEGPRVKVQAYRPLSEFARITYVVNRVERIDGYRIGRSNFDNVCRNEIAMLRNKVLVDHAVVVDCQPPDGSRHPAMLVLVIVDRRAHAHFPADG